MRLFTIAMAIAAAALLAGCDQHPDKTIKIKGKDGNVTISGNNEHMTVKSDDGKTTVEVNSNSLGNQRLPDFAPAYPGAQVKVSVASPTEGGGTFAFETSDTPENVIAFYKDKAASAGLAEKLNMNTNGVVTYMAGAADDKKTLQVITTSTGASTNVQVTWAAK
jgi:hypothetical protein